MRKNDQPNTRWRLGMMAGQTRPTRVAIIGAGNVGSTFAYTLLLSGLATEIVLIDLNRTKAEGEAMDLNHAVPFARPTRIWAGDYSDCAGAAATVIATGVGQLPGEGRLDLVRRNADVFHQVIPAVTRHNSEGILLIATNPVDILTYAAWKLSGMPQQQVLGSGTILDTARFRYLLSQQFDVDPRSVHAFIIGEHGDSEVPVWSLANIAGMRLSAFCDTHGLDYNQEIMNTIFNSTRDAAYHIIERKGATFYAVATGLMRIVEAIIRDQKTVLSIASYIEDYYGIEDVYMSLPAVVDRGGVNHVLRLELSPAEIGRLHQSSRVLKSALSQLDLEGN